MNILFVSTLCRTGEFGGQEIFIRNLSDELDSKDVQNYIASSVNLKKKNSFIISPFKRNIFYNIRILKKIIKLNNITIVHSNDIYSNLLVYLSAGKMKNVIMITTIHDVYTSDYMPLSLRLKKIFYRFLDLMILQKFDMAATVSDYIRQSIQLEDNRIKHIVYGVKHEDKNKSDLKKKYNLQEKDFLIGFCGRADILKKGLDIFIEIISKLHDRMNFKFLICGFDNKKNIEHLFNKFSLNLNAPNIIISGYIKDFVQYMSSLDILVVPSRDEGLGAVVIEGLIEKVPVVVSNIQPFKEIIDGLDYPYIVKENNADNFCRIIEKMYIERPEKTKLNETSEIIKDKYSIKKMTNNYMDCYKKLIDMKK